MNIFTESVSAPFPILQLTFKATLLRHTVLLPLEFNSWSVEDQRSVLLHESALAYRRDCLVNFLAHLERAVL